MAPRMTESSYRPDPRTPELGPEFFDVVEPARFPRHILRFRNQRWARRVGLDTLTDAEWLDHFGCFAPLPDNLGRPLALRYHGHQFQVYNPELGDGRGFLFAQLRDSDGRLLDLGTKGSGRTPWSRGGDGRLTLKGGVREVLATAMLEALGVDTSRSLSLIETGDSNQPNSGGFGGPPAAPAPDAPPPEPMSANPRQAPAPHGSPEAARRLIAMTQPITGTIVQTYLRRRCIALLHETGNLRFHPRCYYKPDDGPTETWPAMIAAVNLGRHPAMAACAEACCAGCRTSPSCGRWSPTCCTC